jgi:MFS family permease
MAQFVNTAGLMALVPVMPVHMAALGVEPSAVGLWAGAAIAAPALPLAATTPLWGRLGDKVGQKWMVVRALVGLSLAMALMAAAAGPLMLLVARLLQGSLGGVVEAAAAFVGSRPDSTGKGSAMGRSYSATAAGALAGPLVGGVLTSTGHLRPFLTSIGIAALILAGLAATALTATPVRTASEAHRGRSRGSLKAVCTRVGWRPLTAGFLAFLGVYGLLPVYAPFVGTFVASAHVGPWVGALHAVMWTGTFFGAIWWGKFNDQRATPVSTMALAAGLTALTVTVQAWTFWMPALVVLRLIQGFCFGALAQSLLLHASNRAPTQERSAHVGTANSFLLMGQFAGPLGAGALLAVASPSVTSTIAGVAIAGGFALLVSRPAPRSSEMSLAAWEPTTQRPPQQVTTGASQVEDVAAN